MIKSFEPHFGESKKNLFTFKELENLLNLRPFINDKRFVIPGDSQYNWKGYGWQTEKNAWPISSIKDVLKTRTAYIRDCGRANKEINQICFELEKTFERPVDCHIYFSFKKNMIGFDKHKDLSDNYIVLCQGKLKVEVWEDNKKIEKVMKPGDYVFVPRGIYHRITPLSNKRLSCSFPITHTDNKFFDEREWLTL